MPTFSLASSNKSQDRMSGFSLIGNNSSREKLNSINLGSQSDSQSLSWLKHEVSGTNLAELDKFSLHSKNSSRDFLFRPKGAFNISVAYSFKAIDVQGDITMMESNSLLSLPNEVLLKICGYLSAKVLRILGIVSK